MFALIKQPDKLTYYDDIPEAPLRSDQTATVFTFNDGDRELLAKDFAYPINEVCGTLLDYSDVDYFNSEKCVLLRQWLMQRLDTSCPKRLRVLYQQLLTYTNEAIHLGTGVVVEL